MQHPLQTSRQVNILDQSLEFWNVALWIGIVADQGEFEPRLFCLGWRCLRRSTGRCSNGDDKRHTQRQVSDAATGSYLIGLIAFLSAARLVSALRART